MPASGLPEQIDLSATARNVLRKRGAAQGNGATGCAATCLVFLPTAGYPDEGFWTNVRFPEGSAMPAAVRIKAGKYGSAISLLLERGGAFQTRHERTLIVDAAQKQALEQAGLIETRGFHQESSNDHRQKKDAG
jgi:hypothetical protein